MGEFFTLLKKNRYTQIAYLCRNKFGGLYTYLLIFARKKLNFDGILQLFPS